MYVDDIKLAGKKIINPMWKVLNKEVDLGEPTSFFDRVILGSTQRQCEISKENVDNYRTMFESRIFRRSNQKITMLGKSEYLFVVLWHGRSCQEMCGTILWVGEQNDSPTLQSINSMPWRPSFQRRRIEIRGRIVKSMLSNCSEMFFLARKWTNLHDRSHKWTQACDKRLSRLISYIHHTCDNKLYCHVGNTAKQCRLGLFQDSDFAGDFEDSKSTSGGTLCIFGSHTFVPISWMCKKQTSVSHSSSESEIISLDAGLRMDGMPALDLWDLIVTVLHGNMYQNDQVLETRVNLQRERKFMEWLMI